MFQQSKSHHNLASGKLVILIHGTFAPDAKWVEPDAILPRALKERFPRAIIKSFRWSGRNTHSARIQAGAELALFIRDTAAQYAANTDIHLIGHSHGGNVALYAIDQCLISPRIKSIAFLGTPFLNIRDRDFVRGAAKFSETVSWLCVFPGLPIWAGLFAEGSQYIYFRDGPLRLFSYLMFFISIGAPVWYFIYGREPFGRWLTRITTNKLTNKYRAIRTMLRHGVPSQPTFVASSDLDEARVWLKMFHISSSIPLKVHHILENVAGTMFLTQLVAIPMVIGLAFAGIIENYHAYMMGMLIPFWVSMTAALAIGVVPFVAMLWATAIRGSAIAFGWEGFVSHLVIDLYPSAQPIWDRQKGSMNFKCTNRQLKGLRHSSFYQDSETINALVNWLDGNIESTAPPPVEPARTRAISHRFKPMISLITVAGMAVWSFFAARSHVASLDIPNSAGLQQPQRGEVISLKAIELLSVPDFYLGSGESKAWTVPIEQYKNNGKCYLVGSANFGNLNSKLFIESFAFSYSSEDLSRKYTHLKHSMKREGKLYKYERSTYIDYLEAENGKRPQFIYLLTEDMSPLSRIQFDLTNYGKGGSKVSLAASLHCANE